MLPAHVIVCQPLGLESEETAGDASGEAYRASTQIGADAPNDEPDRPRYVAACRHALQAALRDLDAGDRLRLSCYYVQELKLAEIGRLFGEHEATVSPEAEPSSQAGTGRSRTGAE